MMADSQMKWRIYGGSAIFLRMRCGAVAAAVGARFVTRQVSGAPLLSEVGERFEDGLATANVSSA